VKQLQELLVGAHARAAEGQALAQVGMQSCLALDDGLGLPSSIRCLKHVQMEHCLQLMFVQAFPGDAPAFLNAQTC
jgi:hypothetical protein